MYIHMSCVNQRLNIFIHVDILVLVSEFVVVAILSECKLETKYFPSC